MYRFAASKRGKTEERRSLKCRTHKRYYKPCPLAVLRARDESNTILNKLFAYCAGVRALKQIQDAQEARKIDVLRKSPNQATLAFEVAKKTIYDRLYASIIQHNAAAKGSDERLQLLREIDDILQKLNDNPHCVWAPMASEVHSDAHGDTYLLSLFDARGIQIGPDETHKTTMSTKSTTSTVAGETGTIADLSDDEEGMEMKYKGPRNVVQTSLSQIAANAALHPPVPTPVHPDHVGGRDRADSHRSSITNMFDLLHVASQDDSHDNLTSIDENEAQEIGQIVLTGHTIPPSHLPSLHQSCWPKHLVEPRRRNVLTNHSVQNNDGQKDVQNVLSNASLPGLSQSGLRQSGPGVPKGTTLAWQRQREKVYDDELKERATDHRMGASPRAEELGWNAKRMQNEKTRYSGHKRQKKSPEDEWADEKTKRLLKSEEQSLRSWCTKRMLDEQMACVEEARSQDIAEAHKAAKLPEPVPQTQIREQRDAVEKKAFAQAHREQAFVPDLSTSVIARTLPSSIERDRIMSGIDRATATANRIRAEAARAQAQAQAQTRKVALATNTGKKKGPKVRFEIETDNCERKRKGPAFRNARVMAEAKMIDQPEDDAWEDEEDCKTDGKDILQTTFNQVKPSRSELEGKEIVFQDEAEKPKDGIQATKSTIEASKTVDGKSSTNLISRISDCIPTLSRIKSAVQLAGQSMSMPKVKTPNSKTSSSGPAPQPGQSEDVTNPKSSTPLLLESKPHYSIYGLDGEMGNFRSPRCAWGSPKTKIQDEDLYYADDSDRDYANQIMSQQEPIKNVFPDGMEPSYVPQFGSDYAVQTAGQAGPASPMAAFPEYDESRFEAGTYCAPSAARATSAKTQPSSFEAASCSSEPPCDFEDISMPTIRATPVASVVARSAPHPSLSNYIALSVACESDESDGEWNPDWVVDRRPWQYSPGGTRI